MYAREWFPPIGLATTQLISRQIHQEIKRTALGELRVRFLTLCGRRIALRRVASVRFGRGDPNSDRTRCRGSRDITIRMEPPVP